MATTACQQMGLSGGKILEAKTIQNECVDSLEVSNIFGCGENHTLEKGENHSLETCINDYKSKSCEDQAQVFRSEGDQSFAKENCRKRKMFLASISSEEDNRNILKLVDKAGCNSAWIGLERDKNITQKKFSTKWIDGSSVK